MKNNKIERGKEREGKREKKGKKRMTRSQIRTEDLRYNLDDLLLHATYCAYSLCATATLIGRFLLLWTLLDLVYKGPDGAKGKVKVKVRKE